MGNFLLANEGTIRLAIFGGMLALMGGLELLAPKRQLSLGRVRRWFQNIGVVVVNTAAVRAAFFFLPALAVGFAALIAERGIGLFNLVDLPFWLEVLLAIVFLDGVIYAQHVAFHLIPPLWRIHRMHHADLDIDVTTALRFHPVEIVLSMVLKLAVIAVLGPAAVAVLIFEILLNGGAMFNHANVDLPRWLDRSLRWLIVTPDFHRVHHSTVVGETNSNYGFSLSLWDRLFGTYRPQPEAGHVGMNIGLAEYRDGARQGFLWMLALPFRR
ncbi:MAG: sterol desaturase family protein [Minwuia sp.]|uniref:sterol desaturase family protein n=1 Tax=Minwuia sp. TaxID=2493630 RepID=UPI003A858548